MEKVDMEKLHIVTSSMYLNLLDKVIGKLGVKEFTDVMTNNFSPLVIVIMPATLDNIAKEGKFINSSIPTLMNIYQSGVEALAEKNGVSREAIEKAPNDVNDYEECKNRMRFVLEAAFEDGEGVEESMTLVETMALMCVKEGVV